MYRIAGLVMAACGCVVVWGCAGEPRGVVVPDGRSGETSEAVALVGSRVTSLPDPGVDPAGFAGAVGERAVVCHDGPTVAVYDVTDGSAAVEIEVHPGECVIAYEGDGPTRTVTVGQRVPPQQQIDGVTRTQLTCGRGWGLTCDPSAWPVVTGPDAVPDPVDGLVGGTGPVSARTVSGLSGFVARYSNSFRPGDFSPMGEHVFVCVRGVPQATVRVDDGHAVSEVVVPRGCHSVYVTDGETRHVSVFEIPPRRYRVAQVYLTQLTCGRGLGRECDPHAFPVLQGPDPATNPASGFVGGTGPQGHPSLKGLSGFVVEYFHVRGR